MRINIDGLKISLTMTSSTLAEACCRAQNRMFAICVIEFDKTVALADALTRLICYDYVYTNQQVGSI